MGDSSPALGSVFDALLAVQSRDLAIAQIEHRHANLPARRQLVDLEGQLADLERALDQLAGSRNAVTARLRVAEDELTKVEGREAGEKRRLYGGTVTVSRELQALTLEVESLGRRRSALEDDVIALMTDLEPIDAAEQELVADRARLDAECGQIRAELAETESALAGELANLRAERNTSAAGADAALMATYEKVRASHGGVGVARLISNTCGGCHLSLPAIEVGRLRRLPPHEVAYCDHCGRLLVRS